MNPYEPTEIKPDTEELNPVFAIPIAFWGFVVVVIAFTWFLDHVACG